MVLTVWKLKISLLSCLSRRKHLELFYINNQTFFSMTVPRPVYFDLTDYPITSDPFKMANS